VNDDCSKVQQYLPTESAKVLNKQICRRSNVKFNPEQVLKLVQLGPAMTLDARQEKLVFVSNYIEVTKSLEFFAL